MRDVLSAIMRSQRASPIPAPPPEPPRKKRYGRPALLLLGGAILGAAPFLFHLWGGKHSTKLSFEHALSIARDPGSPLRLSQPAWVRILILGEDGLASLLVLKREKPTFLLQVQTALNRLKALLDNRKLTPKSRPNVLSFAEALAGIADPGSGEAHVRACVDLIAFGLEEAARGLLVRRQKGGEPGEAASIILSRFRRFLKDS